MTYQLVNYNGHPNLHHQYLIAESLKRYSQNLSSSKGIKFDYQLKTLLETNKYFFEKLYSINTAQRQSHKIKLLFPPKKYQMIC